MIVLDTSAIVAIFRQEPDAARHAARIGADDEPFISAATLVETTLVLRGLKQITPKQADRWLEAFLATGGIRVEPVTAEQAALAQSADLRFGRASGHPAELNFGDCFAYALAAALQAPLLFKGQGFARTDISAAL